MVQTLKDRGLWGFAILVMLVIGGYVVCGFIPNVILRDVLDVPAAAQPVVQLPAERLSEEPLIRLDDTGFNDIYLTNTLVATALVDVIIILIVVFATIGRSAENPKGVYNLMEWFTEGLYNMAEGVVGSQWVGRVFPLAATVFLFILIGNWMEMIPGVDSIGIMHHAKEGQPAHPKTEWNGFEILDVNTEELGFLAGFGVDVADADEHLEEGEHGPDLYVLTPFVRPTTTDINTPLALAIIVFIGVQVFGVWGLGMGYIGKFINTKALANGGMGLMDFPVGLLELILEPVKILSLTFRLLGNIFGGAVLLFVVSTLVSWVIPMGLYVYELFVGAIQAYVFFMLTLVYVQMAQASHGDHDEAHH